MAENKKNEVVVTEKVGVVQSIKNKASGLVNYNEKDLGKLKKEAEKAYDDWYVKDLAVRLLANPQDEEILKETSSLTPELGKALKKILDRKKIRLAWVGGSLLVIGGVAIAATIKGKSKNSSNVDDDSDEEEFEDDVDVDYEELDDVSDEDVDDTPVEE